MRQNIVTSIPGEDTPLCIIDTANSEFITGELDFIRTEWSAAFAHGADTLITIEHFLRSMPGISAITGIEHINWRKPVKSKLKAYATRKKLPNHDLEVKKTSIDAVIYTNTGPIYFYAYAVLEEEDIHLFVRERNPFATLSDSVQYSSDGSYHCIGMQRNKLLVPDELCTATTAEIITIVSGLLLRQIDSGASGLGRNIQAISRVNFGEDLYVTAQTNLENLRTSRSGLVTVPIIYSIAGTYGAVSLGANLNSHSTLHS